jgi:branched-chain amino acid transport system substrate-binding protein
MKIRLSKLGLIIAVLTAVLVLPTPLVTIAKGEVKELQIGCNMPFSGPGASWGNPLRKGMDVYIDLVNEDGGISVGADKYKIKMIYVDDKYNAEGAREAAEKLIYQNKVKFHVGIFGAAIIAAVAPVANKEKVIVIHGNSGGVEVVKPAWPYIFQYGSRLVSGIGAQLEVLKKEQPQIKRVGGLFRDDTLGAVYTRTLDSQRAAIEKKLGIQIAWPPTLYPLGTNDFYPYLGKLKQANVDAVWGAPAPAELALMCKQSYELGYKFWFEEFGTLTDIKSFLSVAGKEAAQYAYCQRAPVWEMPETPPKYKEMAMRIRERYLKQYGEPLEYDGSFAYGSCHLALLFEALGKAGTLNPDVVKQVLQTETLSTFMGTMKADGEKTYGIKNTFPVPTMTGKLKGDKLVYIGQAVDILP